MNTVLVTGGAGFLGSFLVERLVEKGVFVRVFDNLWRGNRRHLQKVYPRIELVEGDIRDITQVRRAASGTDVIFHLASVQGTRFFYEQPDLVLQTGLLGNLNVATAAAENDVQRVVFSSSSEVYGEPGVFPTPETHPLVISDPANPRWSYSSTKIAGEVTFNNFARKYGYATTIVRIHNAYGPRMGWQHVIPEFCKRLILGEEFIIQGDGSETRSFCFVSDIVNGLVLAAEKDNAKGETFNLGNDSQEISVNDLAEKLMAIAEVTTVPRHVPRTVGSTRRRKPDISKSKQLLGYDPVVSLDEGLRITFQWYTEEIGWWRDRPYGHYPWIDRE